MIHSFKYISHSTEIIPNHHVGTNNPQQGVHFLNPTYASHSLHSLVKLCHDAVNQSDFHKMHMIAFLQEKDSARSSTAIVDPMSLYKVVSIQRNTGGQIYTLPNLHSSLHFSVHEDVAKEIIFRLQFLRGSDNPLDSKYIKSNTNFHEDECYVLNRNAEFFGGDDACSDSFPHSDTVFNTITTHAKLSCQDGLLRKLNLSTDPSRKSPSFSFGWTKSDPKKYGDARCNGAGNVQSTLSHAAIDHLTIDGRRALLKVYDIGIKACPDGHDTFTIPHDHKKRVEQRQELNKKLFNIKLKKNLDTQNANEPFMSCEAMTVLIPTILGNHKDVLNDSIKTMSRAVQINVSLSVNETYDEGSPMRNWLTKQGYHDEFPVTMIGYSRMVCNRDSQLEKRIAKFSESTEKIAGYDVGPLRKIISYAINDSESYRDFQGTCEKNRHTRKCFIDTAIEEHQMEQLYLFRDLKDKPNLFLKKFFTRFASSKCASIYQQLRIPFYKMFDLTFAVGVSEEDDDGVRRNYVIKNDELDKEHYLKFFDKMGELLDDYDFASPRFCKNSQLKTPASADWKQKALDKLVVSMNNRSTLESFLLATVDQKVIPACLIEQAIDRHREQPNYSYEFSKGFDNDNCDYIPSIDNTFNGPTIRLPASWDKEVSTYVYSHVNRLLRNTTIQASNLFRIKILT